ncbi:hypothetical protein POTOM_053887 [Populus tomentosa]|uniref:Uncharacterized protein n=1 Tax=Populus tomentosa TaxID=118781 RepID=A0A8X7XY70_POPTO|nr:hypothetical protein POTOM_053887 [Populus tomentosa]
MQMLHMQLEASEKFKTEYQKLYEDAINDLNKVSECYKSCITDLAGKCSSLDDRYSCSLEMLDSAKQESLEWRRKYPNEEEARLADAHGKRPMNVKRTSSEADKEKNGSPAILVIENDKEIKVKIAKLEEAEQKITTLNLDLKGAQEKMDKYELESSALKLQLKDLTDKYESVQTAAHALEMEARILVQDRTQMEQKYS